MTRRIPGKKITSFSDHQVLKVGAKPPELADLMSIPFIPDAQLSLKWRQDLKETVLWYIEKTIRDEHNVIDFSRGVIGDTSAGGRGAVVTIADATGSRVAEEDKPKPE